jgi:hypothetical protein
MNKAKNSAKSLPSTEINEWSAKGIKEYCLLMIEFLRISPSYALARRIRIEGLDKKAQKKYITELYQSKDLKLSDLEKSAILKDFQLILATYDEVGDVLEITFDEWWDKCGINIYGSPFLKPKVAQIARIEKDEEFEDMFNKSIEHYISKTRAHEGNPTSLVIGVPLGMPKAYLLKQISSLIDKAKVPLATKSKRSSKPMAAQRLRSEPLFIQLRTLMAKAKEPNSPLWKIGLFAKVSPKHAKTLDLKESKKKFEDADSKEHLAILTSRALKKAKQVAENAARGSFPNSQNVPYLPNYDFDEIYSRLRVRYKTLKRRA